MRQSTLFTKTRREAPKDEVSKNAQLLIRAGFVHKELAGVYSMLPLGFRVIQKIKRIIAKEMDLLGSQELLMSSIQTKETWEKTNRWDDNVVDIWFKTDLKNGNEIGLGWSHEEPITEMMRSHIASYKDMPIYVHQFQNKLRNETRAKSGIMRCREFVMKDMYSYTTSEEKHTEFYNTVIDSYLNVYRKVGLGDITYVTSASGGVFTNKFSHEFQTVCDAGEDIIYVHKTQPLAINEEIFNDETLQKLNLVKEDFEQKKSAEVGNIFTFGTDKCEQMELYFNDSEGKKNPVFLGSYGIGITRLMGVIVEALSDDKGIVWPKSVAPFDVHLVLINGSDETNARAESIYKKLSESVLQTGQTGQNIEVLFDDRDARAGEKFGDSDLIGIPTRVVVSDKNKQGADGDYLVEVKDRATGEVQDMTVDELIKKLI